MSDFRFGVLDRLERADVEQAALADLGEVRCFQAGTAEDLPLDVATLDAAMVWHELVVTEAVLDRLERCRVLVRVGVGFDSVDLASAGRLGIPVVNVPDYGVNDVADHAVMLLLAVLRRLSSYENALRADPVANWRPELGGRGMRRLTGLRVGVIGFGRIGSAVARRLQAFGCRVAFFDPYLADGVEKSWQVGRFGDVGDLVSQSDVLTLHVPLDRSTERLVDDSLLAVAPEGMILLNTARGGLVDLDAVHRALLSGRLGGFGADVLPVEPPDPDHPLIAAFRADEPWLRGRIALTPHMAFFSEDCERELREKSAAAMADAVLGRPLRNCVNLPHLRDPRAVVAVPDGGR